MNKKEFDKLVKEAKKEFADDKKERVKSYIKIRLQEYEMAKAVVKKIETQFLQLTNNEFDEELLLEYDK